MKVPGSPALRTLVLIMIAVVVIGVIIAKSYYGKINKSVDPRIAAARKLYTQYDQVAGTGDYFRILALLDSIEKIYLETEHYRASFEIGVLENNRAAALLTIALYGDSLAPERNPFHTLETDSVVRLAGSHVLKAIETYGSWNRKFGGLNEQEIRTVIGAGFMEGLDGYDPRQVERYLSNRVREIGTALRENDRRLSVCHTNLGIVYRYSGAYEEAVREYETALSLWDRNLDAENNLNKLLNRPVKKRNILQKLFPPKKK